MELWQVKNTLLSLIWTMRPLLLANTLANSFQIPPSPPWHDYVWKRSLKRAGSSGKGEPHMDHDSGQALWHPSRIDRAQENGEVWLWWPSYHITVTAWRRWDSSHRGAAVCGHGKCRLCPLQWNNQQAAVLHGGHFCFVLPSKWRKDSNNGNETQVDRPQLSMGTFTAPGPSEEQHDGAQADHEVSTVPWEVFWCVCGVDWWWEVLDRGRTGWVGYRRGKPCSHWTCFLAFYCQLPTSTVHLL